MSDHAKPTNSDIMKFLGNLEEKADSLDLKTDRIASTGETERAKIYAQAKLTNGRVNKIEYRLGIIDAMIDRFKSMEDWLHDFKLERKIRKEIKGEDSEVHVSQNIENQVIRQGFTDSKEFKALMAGLAAFFLALAGILATMGAS